MDRFERLEMHFDKDSVPFELKFACNVSFTTNYNPQQLIGCRIQYDDVWYVIEDYDFETCTYMLKPE